MNDADVEDAVLRVLHSAKIAADLALCRFPARPVTKLRLYTARGIPCVMVSTHGLELAHAVNERVAVEDVLKTDPRAGALPGTAAV